MITMRGGSGGFNGEIFALRVNVIYSADGTFLAKTHFNDSLTGDLGVKNAFPGGLLTDIVPDILIKWRDGGGGS